MAASPEINPGVFAEAEKLLGIHFSEQEREAALRVFPLVAKIYELRREFELPNALGLALHFDPRPPGFRARENGPVVRSPDGEWELPAGDEDIAYAPLTQLSRWIERGELSSVRLTELYLERLARLGPELECVVTLTDDRALGEARRADAEIAAGRYRGPLHGIPWGAKDLFDTAGIATTWGSPVYCGRVPKEDAEVVRRLTEAGAVLVAKLSLGELAYGDRWHGGRTRNPWKRDEGSGGSSAGSAAATAAGLVGFALGTETLGSISNPARTCGVVGLRPTFGRVARTGAMALCWTFDKIGPLTRSSEDAALVFDAIRGPHTGDADTVDRPFGFEAHAGASGRRIGFVPAHFELDWVTDSEREALAALRRCGAELVEVELPEFPTAGVFVMVWVEAAAAFQELTLGRRLDELANQSEDDWPNIFRTAHFISAVEYVQLQRLREQLIREMHTCFGDLDAIIGPDMGHVLTPLTNATGHPSLTQRVGFRDDGTPTAITLHGQLFDEGTLVELGIALERELRIPDRRPHEPGSP